MDTVDGRSGAAAPSGFRPPDRAASTGVSPPDGASIPNAGELRHLLEAATPGEWDAVGREVEARCVTSDSPDQELHTLVALLRDDEYIFNARAEADAALIAAMKGALPWYVEQHALLVRADRCRAAPLLYALLKIARAFPDTPSKHAQSLRKIAQEAIAKTPKHHRETD